jgi:hypothetical protein
LKAKSLTQGQILEELWRRGELSFLLHDVQKQMYSAIHGSSERVFVINSSRRLGKSYMLVVMAIEFAIKNPEAQIKLAADTQRAIKKIVAPIFRQVLSTCPRHLRPRFLSHDGVFVFPNNSEIHIAGASLDQADSLRGTAMDLGLIDEAGFIGDLEYLIESVLRPQMLTRPNSRIILASTPPESPDHSFVKKYMEQAISRNAYAKYTIYQNPMLSVEQIEEFMKDAGGADSTTWRREYLAEVITDTSSAVFPEASEEKMESLIFEVQRPQFFRPFTAIDLGYLDYTGVVFGYYHFLLGKIVIEDEILVNKTTSAGIVDLIQKKERELWGDFRPERVIDAPMIVIQDLNAEPHRFACRAPDKSDLTANVNRVRIDIDQSRIIFHPKCRETITQVRFATWNKQRNAFTRNSSGGHQDLVAALIYFCKHIDRVSNPFPADYGYDPYSDFGYARRHKNNTFESIQKMFPRIFTTKR